MFLFVLVCVVPVGTEIVLPYYIIPITGKP